MTTTILSFAVPILITIAIILILALGYVKAPPDQVFIISGLRHKKFCGKSSIRIPFLERIDKLSLKLIPIDVKTSSSVPTADYININVDAAVSIKISDNLDKQNLAAQNFLNKDTGYIGKIAKEVLEGNMREIVGKMTLQEMVSDRQKFAELVKENAEPDLGNMGLDIVAFNVQNFTDNQGVIENLGVDNIEKISKGASIAKAQAQKEVAVAQAEASKEANDAQVKANLEIEQKNTDLQIKQAELKKRADVEKAKADAAYEIQREEQRKTIEETTADANLMRLEKEIALKEKQVTIEERALEASIKKKADAERYAQEQKSDAELYEVQRASEADLFERQKSAEAEKFEATQRAEAVKSKAEAERISMENEAIGITAKGEAEAAAIKAKALAEAEGILKKAEAMKEYGEAAKQQMELDTLKVYFEQLPSIAASVASPMANIKDIYMYGEGNTAKLTEEVMKNITQVNNGLSKSLGFDLQSILSGMFGAKIMEKKDEKDHGHKCECKTQKENSHDIDEALKQYSFDS